MGKSRNKKQKWTSYQGTRRKNMDGYWYVVGERTGGYHYGKPLYEIAFDSGYRTEMTAQDIWRGKIKDWGSPSIYGVGIVGWRVPRPTKHQLYSTWHGMLERCCKCRPGYEDVTVCDRWFRFDQFVEDAEKLPGYDANRLDELTIDKDKLGSKTGPRIYSPETCCWLTVAEQNAYKRGFAKTNARQCPYRGVHWTDNGWIARPQFRGEKRYLGYYREAIDAARVVMALIPGYYLAEEDARIRANGASPGMADLEG